MKIIFDNIVFSLQKAGGISVVWGELLSRMLRNGSVDVSFLEYESSRSNMFRKQLDIPSDKVHKLNRHLFMLRRYFNPIVCSKEPFIFHSSYFRTCPHPMAINVTTVHDFTYERYYLGKKKNAFLHIWQRNRAIRNSDAVVCISNNTKRDLLKYVKGVDEKKLRVIYNGVSEEYKVINDKIEELSEYLLFVGGRSAYKNGKFFIDAISKTEYKVLFCGSPLNDEEKSYLDEVMHGRYKSRSYISNAELNRIYNSCLCLVYPSSYEGFGIPILEAQKAGCPVIAYNSSSIPEVIGTSPLLMQSLTSEELLSKLELLKNPAIRAEIISKGLENAKKFSWDKMYKEYMDLYNELISNKKALMAGGGNL